MIDSPCAQCKKQDQLPRCSQHCFPYRDWRRSAQKRMIDKDIKAQSKGAQKGTQEPWRR